MPKTQSEKEKALAALEKRKASKPEKINNASLYAGSPMYFYCRVCGHTSDVLPESFLGTPKRLCDECAYLKEMGWLE